MGVVMVFIFWPSFSTNLPLIERPSDGEHIQHDELDTIKYHKFGKKIN